MRLSIFWRIMEIEEGVIRRGGRPRWITPSEFIFYSELLGLFSSASILQIEDVALRVVFLLFLPRF